MSQAGLARVGLVLEPANDWLAEEYDHAHIAAFRAVENGFSMMRPDAKGVSLAVDPLGRELVRGEYYATDQLDVIAMMPVQALPTLYSRIGDLFADASIVGIVALTGLAMLRRWTRRKIPVVMRLLGGHHACGDRDGGELLPRYSDEVFQGVPAARTCHVHLGVYDGAPNDFPHCIAAKHVPCSLKRGQVCGRQTFGR
jgi:hypothetical protein